MTNITTSNTVAFDWQGTPLRTFKDPKGMVWFVAQDVCQALGLKNTARALSRLDSDMRGITSVHTPGGLQSMTTVTEPGLYALVFSSRKAVAKTFQRWVTGDVLPAIRAHGVYVQGEERLLSAASVEELQAQVAKLEAIATQAIRAKAATGLDALEEREARHAALKFLSKHRKRKPRSHKHALSIQPQKYV